MKNNKNICGDHYIEKNRNIRRDYYNTIKKCETGEIDDLGAPKKAQPSIEEDIIIFNRLYESLQDDINKDQLTKENMKDYIQLMTACIVIIKRRILTENQKFELKDMISKLLEAKKIKETVFNSEFIRKNHKTNTR